MPESYFHWVDSDKDKKQLYLRVKQKIARLRKKLNTWNEEYHVNDRPSVSDSVYDQNYRKLKALETQHPELITSDSPTQKIGGI